MYKMWNYKFKKSKRMILRTHMKKIGTRISFVFFNTMENAGSLLK